jgi:hypothetical protein
MDKFAIRYNFSDGQSSITKLYESEASATQRARKHMICVNLAAAACAEIGEDVAHIVDWDLVPEELGSCIKE